MGQQQKDTLFESESVFDTTIIDIFYIEDLDYKTPYEDTTLLQFQNLLPKEQWGNTAHNLGNHAGTHIPSQLAVPNDLQSDWGYHQYDPLLFTRTNLQRFSINQPFTYLFVNPYGGIQNNFLVEAAFSRNFQNNLNATLLFKRNRIEDIYTNQAAKASRIGFSLHYWHPSSKYQTIFTYLGNLLDESHNGGTSIDVEPDLVFNPNLRVGIPIKLSNANARYQNLEYHLDQFFKPFAIGRSSLTLHHHIGYENGFYKYTDAVVNNQYTATDSLYYTETLLVEPRGLRAYVFQKVLKNKLGTQWNLLNIADLSIEGGHEIRTINNDNYIEDRNTNIYSKVGLKLQPIKYLEAFTSLTNGWYDQSNTFNFTVGGNVNLGKWGKLYSTFKQIRKQVDYNLQQVIISGVSVYDQSFQNEDWTEWLVGITIPISKTKFEGKLIRANHFTLFDENIIPIQINEATLIQQLKVAQDFTFWKIHSENVAVFQNFAENYWTKPSLVSQHQLYFQSHAFKKNLQLQIGGYFKNIVQEKHFNYNALIGSPYPTDNSRNWYPYFDLFANAKIQTFRFYVKLENVYQSIQYLEIESLNLIKDPLHYDIYQYPQYDFAVRFGLSWQLKN